jgi:acyl dehydratase
MLTMGVSVQVAVDWVGDPGKVSDYSTRFTKMVDVDAAEGAVLVVTGKIAEINLETNEVRVDLTTMFGETSALGKAQVRVRL